MEPEVKIIHTGTTSQRPCTCQHEFQDKTYGRGIRLHNWAVKAKAWRCTVCGKDTKQ